LYNSSAPANEPVCDAAAAAPSRRPSALDQQHRFGVGSMCYLVSRFEEPGTIADILHVHHDCSRVVVGRQESQQVDFVNI
jgi:hypothetical protein